MSWMRCSSIATSPGCAGRQAVSSAFTWPGCGVISRMRLPTLIASAIEWVTNSTVKRVSSQSCQQFVLHLAPRQRVERGEGFVHQQDVGLHRHAAGDRDALLHAAGQRVRIDVGESASGCTLSIYCMAFSSAASLAACRDVPSRTRRSGLTVSTAAAGRIPGTPSCGQARAA